MAVAARGRVDVSADLGVSGIKADEQDRNQEDEPQTFKVMMGRANGLALGGLQPWESVARSGFSYCPIQSRHCPIPSRQHIFYSLPVSECPPLALQHSCLPLFCAAPHHKQCQHHRLRMSLRSSWLA